MSEPSLHPSTESLLLSVGPHSRLSLRRQLTNSYTSRYRRHLTSNKHLRAASYNPDFLPFLSSYHDFQSFSSPPASRFHLSSNSLEVEIPETTETATATSTTAIDPIPPSSTPPPPSPSPVSVLSFINDYTLPATSRPQSSASIESFLLERFEIDPLIVNNSQSSLVTSWAPVPTTSHSALNLTLEPSLESSSGLSNSSLENGSDCQKTNHLNTNNQHTNNIDMNSGLENDTTDLGVESNSCFISSSPTINSSNSENTNSPNTNSPNTNSNTTSPENTVSNATTTTTTPRTNPRLRKWDSLDELMQYHPTNTLYYDAYQSDPDDSLDTTFLPLDNDSLLDQNKTHSFQNSGFGRVYEKKEYQQELEFRKKFAALFNTKNTSQDSLESDPSNVAVLQAQTNVRERRNSLVSVSTSSTILAPTSGSASVESSKIESSTDLKSEFNIDSSPYPTMELKSDLTSSNSSNSYPNSELKSDLTSYTTTYSNSQLKPDPSPYPTSELKADPIIDSKLDPKPTDSRRSRRLSRKSSVLKSQLNKPLPPLPPPSSNIPFVVNDSQNTHPSSLLLHPHKKSTSFSVVHPTNVSSFSTSTKNTQNLVPALSSKSFLLDHRPVPNAFDPTLLHTKIMARNHGRVPLNVVAPSGPNHGKTGQTFQVLKNVGQLDRSDNLFTNNAKENIFIHPNEQKALNPNHFKENLSVDTNEKPSRKETPIPILKTLETLQSISSAPNSPNGFETFLRRNSHFQMQISPQFTQAIFEARRASLRSSLYVHRPSVDSPRLSRLNFDDEDFPTNEKTLSILSLKSFVPDNNRASFLSTVTTVAASPVHELQQDDTNTKIRTRLRRRLMLGRKNSAVNRRKSVGGIDKSRSTGPIGIEYVTDSGVVVVSNVSRPIKTSRDSILVTTDISANDTLNRAKSKYPIRKRLTQTNFPKLDWQKLDLPEAENDNNPIEIPISLSDKDIDDDPSLISDAYLKTAKRAHFLRRLFGQANEPCNSNNEHCNESLNPVHDPNWSSVEYPKISKTLANHRSQNEIDNSIKNESVSSQSKVSFFVCVFILVLVVHFDANVDFKLFNKAVNPLISPFALTLFFIFLLFAAFKLFIVAAFFHHFGSRHEKTRTFGFKEFKQLIFTISNLHSAVITFQKTCLCNYY